MTTLSVADGVSRKFADSFLDTDLERAIRSCDSDELVPLFRKWLPQNQPILEAGSGTGRWVGWFARHGWDCTGVDLSEELCQAARKQIPGATFVAGDMRGTPFTDSQFGSIVSLGAVEHLIEGPTTSLQEFWRVLRPGGIAIVTVPNFGWMRWISPKRYLRSQNWARRLWGMDVGDPDTVRDVLSRCVAGWDVDLLVHQGKFDFYSYYFTDAQMRTLIEGMGWQIEKASVHYKHDGIGCAFGRLIGRYHGPGEGLRWNLFGRLLRLLFAASNDGLMLGYVLRKPA